MYLLYKILLSSKLIQFDVNTIDTINRKQLKLDWDSEPKNTKHSDIMVLKLLTTS